MASRESASSPEQKCPEWQSDFQSAMEEGDLTTLFKRIEVAEAAILIRREILARCLDNSTEGRELELALASLRKMKTRVLKFS